MPKKSKKEGVQINNKKEVNKDETPEPKGAASGESVGEKFFSEFSRSDFIGDGEVAEVDIVDAFDPAEELGFEVEGFKDDSY